MFVELIALAPSRICAQIGPFYMLYLLAYFLREILIALQANIHKTYRGGVLMFV